MSGSQQNICTLQNNIRTLHQQQQRAGGGRWRSPAIRRHTSLGLFPPPPSCRIMEVYIHSFHGGIVTTVTTRPFMIGYNTQIFTFCRHSSLLLLVARTQGGATVTPEDAWRLLLRTKTREGRWRAVTAGPHSMAESEVA